MSASSQPPPTPPAPSPEDTEAEARRLQDDIETEAPPDDPESATERDANGDDAPPDSSAHVDDELRRYLSMPPIRISQLPDLEAGQPADEEKRRSARPSKEEARRYDQRLAEIEPLLSQGRWVEVFKALEGEDVLPPHLALVFAIAQKEASIPGRSPEQIAIQAVAALLGVRESNATALVVAKRALRTNPIAWQKRKAPTRTSVLLIILVTIVGAGVGYFASPGSPLPFY